MSEERFYPRVPTEVDQDFLEEVKEEYEKLSGTNPEIFEAVLVSTQGAGPHYFFKVDTGEDTYIHIRLFVPPPGSHKRPSLVSFQANKKMDDKLEYFCCSHLNLKRT